MQYVGGKSRIATPLAQILNATGGACFVSLFCGSCSVESKVTGYDRIILNDKHKYLIALLRGVETITRVVDWKPFEECEAHEDKGDR